MADIPRERWTATSRRQVLRDRLEKASTAQLAAFYVEAIRALREGDDQVRFSVAGHMLRELQGGREAARLGKLAGSALDALRQAGQVRGAKRLEREFGTVRGDARPQQ